MDRVPGRAIGRGGFDLARGGLEALRDGRAVDRRDRHAGFDAGRGRVGIRHHAGHDQGSLDLCDANADGGRLLLLPPLPLIRREE